MLTVGLKCKIKDGKVKDATDKDAKDKDAKDKVAKDEDAKDKDTEESFMLLGTPLSTGGSKKDKAMDKKAAIIKYAKDIAKELEKVKCGENKRVLLFTEVTQIFFAGIFSDGECGAGIAEKKKDKNEDKEKAKDENKEKENKEEKKDKKRKRRMRRMRRMRH